MNTVKYYVLGLVVMFTALTAMGQVRVGLRTGLTVNELRLDRDLVGSSNRAGYTAGMVLDLNIPVVGLGIEASAMYTHRNNRLTDDNHIYKRHYIDIPLYARYRLPIPGVERIFTPVIFTGPDFSILFDEENPSDDYKSRRTFVSWDVGGGVDLFNHLRVTATYGIGMSKAMKYINREYNGDKVYGKDKHWTLSAAWLF